MILLYEAVVMKVSLNTMPQEIRPFNRRKSQWFHVLEELTAMCYILGCKEELKEDVVRLFSGKHGIPGREICRTEARPLLQGDIPYLYTFGNCVDLYSAGKCISKGFPEGTRVGFSLYRIDRMNEQELSFEKRLIREALTAFKNGDGDKDEKRTHE